MKDTGIVRRIDDLGRVVIPKTIRKEHNISDGDPMEIFIFNDGDEEYICFKKYAPEEEKEDYCITPNDRRCKDCRKVDCKSRIEPWTTECV